MEQQSRVRHSLIKLQEEYDKGNKKPLDNLMRAFKGVKELPHTDPKSFFVLAGYHGLPFKGAGWGNAAYWGGYCQHGNILFPTWHRVHLYKLEESLRSIEGCEDVTLPYWDETDDYTQQYGIPTALTQEKWTLDGKEIDNPLRSYIFQATVYNSISDRVIDYTKRKGYETKRYPLAGVEYKDEDRDRTNGHNAQFPNYDKNVKLLNENIKGWLLKETIQNGNVSNPIYEDFRNCLHAPNYTVFSNTSSARQWNLENEGAEAQVSLESPHNHIHLAIGGYTAPKKSTKKDSNPEKPHRPIEGASGDMGENDTASFDPIFDFHHANIDRMFWIWQRLKNQTDKLEIIEEYPGTNTTDEQGPTPGLPGNTWLTLETPLLPFKKTEADGEGRFFNSLDCVNIEKQLGYTYSTGSLDPGLEKNLEVLGAEPKQQNSAKLLIGNLDRNQIRGSFVIAAYMEADGQEIFLGADSILSRWNLRNCKNCQNNTEVTAIFNIPDVSSLKIKTQKVVITTHSNSVVVKKNFHEANEGEEAEDLKLTADSESNVFRHLQFSII